MYYIILYNVLVRNVVHNINYAIEKGLIPSISWTSFTWIDFTLSGVLQHNDYEYILRLTLSKLDNWYFDFLKAWRDRMYLMSKMRKFFLLKPAANSLLLWGDHDIDFTASPWLPKTRSVSLGLGQYYHRVTARHWLWHSLHYLDYLIW